MIEEVIKGQFKRKSIDIKVYMRAPVIVIPENVFDSS